ncbi:pyrroline-5-carboxylate reductase [Candidatus Peregrinibacteria bacterium]|nr:pyrroline-5-carboxylate reductase [Candidatus Peregrinibacteria bacterium]
MREHIAIIGAGNMGSALFQGLLKHFPEDSLSITDRHPEKLSALRTKRVSTDPKKILANASVAILAVKPQSFGELCADVKPLFAGKLIVSIMAGITIEKLERMTGAKRIVRAMPNLGVQVQRSVTEWFASLAVTKKDRVLVKNIFDAVGASFEVQEEEWMDDIGAVSGCGPAYFFFLCELLQQKAESVGFDPASAQAIAVETFAGSAELLARGSKTPAEWRAAVTSKGGVTEAALTHLREQGFDRIFLDALDRAAKRSRELSA